MALTYVAQDGTSIAVASGFVRRDVTAGSETHQLPDITMSRGDTFVFEKTDASGNTLTVKPDTGSTINGSGSSQVLTLQFQTVSFYAPLSGVDWLIRSTTISSDAATHAALTAAHGATGAVVGTTNTQTVTNKTLTSPKVGTAILDTGGNELVKVTATASAINEITVANAAIGTGPTISATGDDTDVDLTIAPKGAGLVNINGLNAQAKITTISGDGAITIKTGVVALTKGSAAAITVAAPSSGQAGTTLKIFAGSAFAHVITFTGATLDDGVTGGGKTTVTMAAFVGSSIEVTAYNLRWTVVAKNAITSVA